MPRVGVQRAQGEGSPGHEVPAGGRTRQVLFLQGIIVLPYFIACYSVMCIFHSLINLEFQRTAFHILRCSHTLVS